MDRFSKENIDKLVDYHEEPWYIIFIFDCILSPILDSWPFLGIFICTVFGVMFQPIFLIFNFLLLPFSIYFLYLHIVKYHRIKVNHYSIPIKNLDKPLRFIFVSDLHMGKFYEQMKKEHVMDLVNKINGLKIELIVFGGDFIDDAIEKDLISLLKNITGKKIAVYGNHDQDYQGINRTENHPEELIAELKIADIEVLINQGETINLNGQAIYFFGIPDLYSKSFDFTELISSRRNIPQILLSHNPDVIDFIGQNDPIDLILSGHTHSGQIYFDQKIHIPMPVKRQWLAKGIFNLETGHKLFISQGVGYSGFRSRIGTDAESCVIELTPIPLR